MTLKRKRRLVFGTTFTLASIGTGLLLLGIQIILEYAFGWELVRHFNCGLGGLCVATGFYAARRACRRLGVSQESSITESLARPEPNAAFAPVEIREGAAVWWTKLLFGIAIASSFGAMSWMMRGEVVASILAVAIATFGALLTI